MPTLDDVRRAADQLSGRIHRTPMVTCSALDAMFGGPLSLKAELFQKTGSFKVRGLLSKTLQLTPEQRERGVVTVSAGNAAGALAWAARDAGVPATVVMATTAVQGKIDAARAYGAQVELVDGDLITAYEAIRDERKLTGVHPFDDLDVITGHGSLGLELLADAPQVRTVLVPIGGGGLISGVALAVKLLDPSVRVVGVEPAGADVVSRSLAAGSPQKLPTAKSLADGLAAPVCGAHTFALISQYVDEVVRVGEDAILAATRLVMSRTKLALEPAAAAPFAALLEGSLQLTGPTASVISGGNLDVGQLFGSGSLGDTP
ncbi:Pyridoxal-5'-phosphate-dependent protein beta subunit [Kribbella flavida DSM 17836]|uniref:Pyridoxal-5'-phosphate-dependent protein beta subunit n=1 Tax=Kribbella flavida (strain DSM 17836 / JCM 10339 / NBRC 14399) TaxID=479435 RepID=D2PWJ8_KRIFD|nr:threonine/serine dehydratase [Kribbella flavida]ADB33467.1 Pyridoxal-5'-phosphate-dependent protein beta subunit [Kribbella flavida DSM 17836]